MNCPRNRGFKKKNSKKYLKGLSGYLCGFLEDSLSNIFENKL